MTTTTTKMPVKAATATTVGGWTIDLHAARFGCVDLTIGAPDGNRQTVTFADETAARAAANAAWRTLTRSTAPLPMLDMHAGLMVRAALATADPHYALNALAGRCPDGCCGPGADCEGSAWSDAVDRAARFAR